MNDIDIKWFWSQGKAKHSVIEFYRREDIKNIKKCTGGKKTSEWTCQNGSRHKGKDIREMSVSGSWTGRVFTLSEDHSKIVFMSGGHISMIGSWKNILMKKLKLIWREWGFIWEQLCQLMVQNLVRSSETLIDMAH